MYPALSVFLALCAAEPVEEGAVELPPVVADEPPPIAEPIAPPVGVTPSETPEPAPPSAPPPEATPRWTPPPPQATQPAPQAPSPTEGDVRQELEERPSIGPLAPQPWAVVVASMLNVHSLLAPIPLLLWFSVGTFAMAGVLLNDKNTTTTGAANTATTGIVAVLGLVALPVALSGLVGGAVAVGLAVSGLAAPPSMDTPAPKEDESALSRLASRTSVVPLEKFLAGKWPGTDSANRVRAIFAGLLVSGGGVGVLLGYVAAAAALIAAVAVAVVAAACAAVALFVAVAKDSKGSSSSSSSSSVPSHSVDDGDPPRTTVILGNPFVPWWWLFWAPPPPLAAGVAPETRSVERYLMSVAIVAFGLLPVDMGVRLVARGLRAVVETDDVEERDPPARSYLVQPNPG